MVPVQWPGAPPLSPLQPSVPLHRPLTPREAEVLEMVLQGLGHAAIAAALGMTVATVRANCRTIDTKIPGSRSRAHRWHLWAAGCPLEYLS